MFSFTPPPLPQIDPRKAQLRENLIEWLWPLLVRSLAPQLPSLPSRHLSDLITRGLRDALQDDLLESIAALLREQKLGDDILWAEIAKLPLPELFQLLEMQRQTGALIVEAPPSLVEIYLHEGRIAQALGYQIPMVWRLGRYLIAQGDLNPTELDLFLRARSTHSRLPLGEQLILLGYIQRDALKRACLSQTSDLIYEVLRWKEGKARFILLPPETPQWSRITRLHQPIEPIVMEGMRRLDEWTRMLLALPTEAILASTSFHDRLSSLEQSLLALVDGKRSTQQIVDLSSDTPFLTYQALFQLTQRGLLFPLHKGASV